jgi:DNA-binding transcriptional regulator YhcF (GntR family)
MLLAPEKLFGKGMREAARDYGQNHETFGKTLKELQDEGFLVLIPLGPGKQTVIGAIAPLEDMRE